MAKKMAPTRPHPSAPDTPPGNKLLGPGVGLVDRARDLLTGRGKSEWALTAVTAQHSLRVARPSRRSR